jgi:ribose transport system ATP-binding protein
MDAPLVEFRGICKGFFGVSVLKDVSFTLRGGSVLGLIGENGAGKSTMMNILGGVLRPDAGVMFVGGERHEPRSTRDANRRGIAFIHQELNLFTNLSIAENLHLPSLPRRRIGPVPLPIVDRGRMRERSRQLLEAVELDKAPETPLDELSPGERQLVEIARAVGSEARVIIFDEPTTSLTYRESQRLFSLIARLRGRGVGIVYISHQLEDVLKLCDDVLVLRDGQVVGSGAKDQFTVPRMISLMVGRQIEQMYPARTERKSAGEAVLEVKGVSRRGVVEDVSFTLHRGEILGLSGLMGSGRTELARILFGVDPYDRGEIRLNGEPLRPTPGECIRRGMAFLTESRREEGLMMERGVVQNAALASLDQYADPVAKWIRRRRLHGRISEVSASVRLAGTATSRQAVRTLSGGNQQKVVLAKWLMRTPTVLILDEPTRGIDVGAKTEIYRIIQALADDGAAILLVSSELEELMGMCDRILVMRAGRIEHVAQGTLDREAIMTAAFGSGGGLM